MIDPLTPTTSATAIVDNDKSNYIVGFSTTKPFISREDLQDHLVVLAAFRQLKQRWRSRSLASSAAPPAYTGPSTHATEPGTAGDGAPAYEYAAPAPYADESLSWAAFLTKALVRFELYVTNVLPKPSAQVAMAELIKAPYHDTQSSVFAEAQPLPLDLLPPLDVAMVWHTYLLNPSRYYEDAVRIKARAALSSWQFPLKQLAVSIRTADVGKTGFEGAILDVPSAARTWTTSTGLEYDLLTPENASVEHSASSFGTHVFCPRSGCNRAILVSYETLAQPTLSNATPWSSKCESCGQVVSPATLSGRRFLDDVERWSTGGNDRSGWRLRGGVLSAKDGRYFFKDPYGALLYRLVMNQRSLTAGSVGRFGHLVTEEGEDRYGSIVYGTRTADEVFAEAACDITLIAQSLELQVITASKGPADKNDHHNAKENDNSNLKNNLLTKDDSRKDLKTHVEMLMSFYLPIASNVVSPASLDLVGAICRQERFIASLEQLSWLPPSPLVTKLDTTLLSQAISRYHRYLHLHFSSPSIFLAPTLDIDLAWHTHMLSATYYDDTVRVVGRFIDHQDKLEKTELGKAFDRTAKEWKRNFVLPFSQCGCGVNDGKLVSLKGKELLGGLRAKLKGKSKGDIAEASKPVTPDHPSDHNAITLIDAESKAEITEGVGTTCEGGHRNPFQHFDDDELNAQPQNPFISMTPSHPTIPGHDLPSRNKITGSALSISGQAFRVRANGSLEVAESSVRGSTGAYGMFSGLGPAAMMGMAGGFAGSGGDMGGGGGGGC